MYVKSICVYAEKSGKIIYDLSAFNYIRQYKNVKALHPDTFVFYTLKNSTASCKDFAVLDKEWLAARISSIDAECSSVAAETV